MDVYSESYVIFSGTFFLRIYGLSAKDVQMVVSQ